MIDCYRETEDGTVEPCELRDLFDKRWKMKTKMGDVEISTVFLAFNHAYLDTDLPVLWETMIFGGEHDEYVERYTSRAAAIVGHTKAVAMVAGTRYLLSLEKEQAK